MASVPAFERQIFVADFVLPFQLLDHFLARGFIFEQTDLKQLLPDQLIIRVTEQFRHERIGVGDFASRGIEQEDAVMRRFKEPAVADFRNAHLILGPSAPGDVHHDGAAGRPVAQALGFNVHALRRPARAHQFEITGLFGLVREDLFEKGIESGTQRHGEQPAEGLPHQPGPLDPDPDCAPVRLDLAGWCRRPPG